MLKNNFFGLTKIGKLNGLHQIGIDTFKETNVHWPKLELFYFLLSCTDEALRNIVAAVDRNLLPFLHTICIKEYGVYDAGLLRTLSDKGIDCHETCTPCGDTFSGAICYCQKK